MTEWQQSARERRDFPAALSDALQSSELTLDRVAARLAAAGTPVSVATLSYWQTGRSLPTRSRSVAAVSSLEQVFALPEGHLTGLLPQTPEQSWKMRDMIGNLELIDEVLESMGLDLEPRMLTVSAHDSLWLSADRISSVSTVRLIMQVTSTEERSFPSIHTLSDGEPPVLVPVAGCRLGQQFVDADRGMSISELVLPRVYRSGELVRVEFEVDWGRIDNPSANHLEWIQPNHGRMLVLDMTFEGDPPARVWLEERATGDGELLARQPVPVLGHHVQSVVVNPRPVMYRLVVDDD